MNFINNILNHRIDPTGCEIPGFGPFSIPPKLLLSREYILPNRFRLKYPGGFQRILNVAIRFRLTKKPLPVACLYFLAYLHNCLWSQGSFAIVSPLLALCYPRHVGLSAWKFVVFFVTSHKSTVPSILPLARVRPSGLKATALT